MIISGYSVSTPKVIRSLTNGSPDWVNAIAASRTTLKVEPLFLLFAIVLTAKNFYNGYDYLEYYANCLYIKGSKSG
ncbi:hypothetical protein [Nostoc sp. DSM 114167]|uniref:hypothetical protein n=1 Tax=Nostoc sp. DSM 114167 TaxID=3439050 RepID=UPI004045E7A5